MLSRISQKLTATIFLAILLSVAYTSFILARSNTHLYRAQNYLASQPGYPPSAAQVFYAQREMVTAMASAPSDSNNMDLTGRINYLAATYSDNTQEREALLESAIEHHQNALTERRNWPYSHVNILFARAALAAIKNYELDTAFAFHFAEAKRLGIDDKAVIRDLVHLGVQNWGKLAEVTQKETAMLTEIALKRGILSERSFRSFLESQGQLYRICAQLYQFDEKIQLCNG